MSDNIPVTPGTGKTILADEVNHPILGVGLAQIVKLMDGTIDSTNVLVIDSSGAITVKLPGALPTGNNSIGNVGVNTLPSLPAGTNNIGSVTLAASELFLGKVGTIFEESDATFTRPNDATQYTPSDAINSTNPAAILFAQAARVLGGSGYIVRATIQTNAISAANARLKLHLFRTNVSAQTDNTTYTHLWANRTSYIGSIAFDGLQLEGSGSDAVYTTSGPINIPFVCATGSQDIYGLLETLDTFTPTNNQSFYISLLAGS